MLKTTLSKTELNSLSKYCARSERERRGRWLTDESGEQAQARATIREIPDKNIRKARTQ
jgi:hypothetical protein